MFFAVPFFPEARLCCIMNYVLALQMRLIFRVQHAFFVHLLDPLEKIALARHTRGFVIMMYGPAVES